MTQKICNFVLKKVINAFFNKNEIAYRSDIWSEMLSVDLKSKLISKVLMLQN